MKNKKKKKLDGKLTNLIEKKCEHEKIIDPNVYNNKNKISGGGLTNLIEKKSENETIIDSNTYNKKIKKILKNFKSVGFEFNENLAKSLANAVLVNKSLLNKDGEKLKQWKQSNGYDFFEKLMELIDNYYKKLGVDVEDLRKESIQLQKDIIKYNQIIHKHKKTIEFINK